MPTKVKVQAKDVSSAIAKGLKDLGLRRDQVEVTVLEHPKKGFLGIGAKPALVEIRQKRWSTSDLDAQIYMDVPRKNAAAAAATAIPNAVRETPITLPTGATTAAAAASLTAAPRPKQEKRPPKPTNRSFYLASVSKTPSYRKI